MNVTRIARRAIRARSGRNVLFGAAIRFVGRVTSCGDILPAAGSAEGASVTRSNILYLIIGALVVAAAVMSYQLYQDRKQPEGMRIDLGPNGISIEKK
jgi:hypothetical protein